MKNEFIEEIYDSYLTREDEDSLPNLMPRKCVTKDIIYNEKYEIFRKRNTE